MSASVARSGTVLSDAADDLAGVVRYAVWKGAGALLRGQAVGDVDVLVHPNDLAAFVRILQSHGFVRAPEGRWYRDAHVVSLLGADGPEGELVHVDAATAVVARRPPWSTRVLDVATEVLDHAECDPGLGLPVSTPADECALRLVEWVYCPSLAGPRRRRHRWRRLQQALSATRVEDVTDSMERLVGPEAAEGVARVLEQPSRGRRRALRAAVEPWVWRGSVTAAGRGVVATTLARLATAAGRPTAVRRHLEGGGRIVAVIGADGAGKSTLVKGLAATLGDKLAVTTTYLGSGAGPSSWYRAPLRWGRRLLAPSSARTRRPASTSLQQVGLESVARTLWACTLALEKVQKVRRAERARTRGLLVLCDRYPQVQFSGNSDGPLLAGWLDHRSRVLRGLARWEQRRYDQAVAIRPDLVVHLCVDLATATHRRPLHDPDDLAQRIERMAALDLGTTTRSIDATGTPAQVRARVLRAVLVSERQLPVDPS